jgi:hypothetical protein
MAKSSNAKTGGPARVRLVVLDAEMPDGDIGAFTHVLQNALRGSTTVMQRVQAPNGTKTITHQPSPEVDSDINEDLPDVEDANEEPQPARTRAPRKPSPTPDIVNIDMDSEVSLATFANGKDAGSQHKKYLISAAWLKEHRSTDAVGAGHIYTCFRSMNWSTNIPDFWQPLRDLKAKKYFSRTTRVITRSTTSVSRM